MNNEMGTTNIDRSDMLARLDKIDITEENIIPAVDREVCRKEEELFRQCLSRLKHWYDFFARQSEMLRERYRFELDENGLLHGLRRIDSSDNPDNPYSDLDWLPFPQFETIADKRRRACERFSRRIIEHFNEKYHITVPQPTHNEMESVRFDDPPGYMKYVNMVITYLDGQNFRAKAEEEIITAALHAAQVGNYGKAPTLKGRTISFYAIAEPYTSTRGRLYLPSYSQGRIDNLCAALVLFADNRLDGGKEIIQGFNADDLHTTIWYDMAPSRCGQMKIYKNGKVDIRFQTAADAAACFEKLRLYTLIQHK